MKKNLITLTLLLAAFTTFGQKKTANPAKATIKKQTAPVKINEPGLKSGLDSASYSFGLIMATNLKTQGLTGLNYDFMVRGLKDAFNSQKPMLSAENAQTAIGNFFKESSKLKYAATIAAGKAFFESNKKAAGIITTVSGLQYQVLKTGSGEKPGATTSVTVHYKGTLLNGTPFDNSYDRGEPNTFAVNNVIAGWTEGLQLMQKGAKFKFFVPYNLAYGERAPGPEIPAFSDLIFEIELLKIDGK
ncbi:FKBP-type peptidyl-prolyl cis-trans isomerase [Pedobacter sp. CG_S7]|uniref:FKBP-type peptidyl-prolyl cis-trans isomerase n=1 Tax=Pedobacter sp. CG_S7 TaxID=3143930 RepID=UPI0033984BFE